MESWQETKRRTTRNDKQPFIQNSKLEHKIWDSTWTSQPAEHKLVREAPSRKKACCFINKHRT